MDIINTVGRRKTSVARVFFKLGKGEIIVNKRALTDYFPSEVFRMIINQPFDKTGQAGKYDVNVRVYGGGLTGQAGAIRLALARALCKLGTDTSYRGALKSAGLLTRDPRMVERKKYGRRGARRKFQFSKR